MQRIFSFLILLSVVHPLLMAQSYDYSIGQQLEKIDSVQEYLEWYESFGVKNTGSQALNNTRDGLIAKYQQFGYTSIALDSFMYSGMDLQNIIIEKPGIDPNRWIIVCAHYDSYPDSKGANDNGSGVVACLQIARIMKNIETIAGLRIIHFSAEENGLVGSEHYVANSLDTQEQIDLILNLDQLGGTKNADNSKIVCERDENNSPSFNNALSYKLTDTLATLTQVYSSLNPVIRKAYSSDYIPFQDSGYTITGLYQESNYPFYHQSGDLVANMDIEATKQVIQVAVAASMYFSRNTLPLSTNSHSPNYLKYYPNPAQNILTVTENGKYSILFYNSLGALCKEMYFEGKAVVDISDLDNGSYFIEFLSEQNNEIKRSRLIIAH